MDRLLLCVQVDGRVLPGRLWGRRVDAYDGMVYGGLSTVRGDESGIRLLSTVVEYNWNEYE